jgi:hypothetical protein
MAVGSGEVSRFRRINPSWIEAVSEAQVGWGCGIPPFRKERERVGHPSKITMSLTVPSLLSRGTRRLFLGCILRGRGVWGTPLMKRCPDDLFAFVGLGRTYAGADIPAGFAIRVAGGDVVEFAFVGVTVGIPAIESGQCLVA